MNREILFKAKRKDNGEWVEGKYIYNAYKILNEVAGLMGLEVTAVRDRRTKQEWKR